MRIVWAVDPLFTEDRFLRRILGFLRDWCDQFPTEILPVYVLSEAELGLSAGENPRWPARYKDLAQTTFLRRLQGIQWPELKSPEVILSQGATTRAAAKDLEKFARRKKADLILTATHGKKGVARALLGSFAETLAHVSSVPLLVVRPDSEMRFPLRQIVYASDFSRDSERALVASRRLLQLISAPVSVVHHAEPPVALAPEWSALEWNESNRVHETWLRQSKLRFRKALSSAKLRGEVQLLQRTGRTADVLSKAAEKPGTLLALATEHGPVHAALLGSVSREALRVCRSPILLLKP